MELQYNFVDYNRQYRFIFISVEVRKRHQTEDLGRIQHFGMCACVFVCVCVYVGGGREGCKMMIIHVWGLTAKFLSIKCYFCHQDLHVYYFVSLWMTTLPPIIFIGSRVSPRGGGVCMTPTKLVKSCEKQLIGFCISFLSCCVTAVTNKQADSGPPGGTDAERGSRRV